MNFDNAQRLGKFIGEFFYYDESVSEARRFHPHMRIRAKLNIRQPLKIGTFIKREDESTLWLQFRYERLSDFYYQCGMLGHSQISCLSNPSPSGGVEDPRHTFGPWLRPNIILSKEYVHRATPRQKSPIGAVNDDRSQAPITAVVNCLEYLDPVLDLPEQPHISPDNHTQRTPRIPLQETPSTNFPHIDTPNPPGNILNFTFHFSKFKVLLLDWANSTQPQVI